VVAPQIAGTDRRRILKLKAILILAAILAVTGSVYYFVSRPKPPAEPPAKYFVWDFTMDELQKVTISLPKDNRSESFVKHPDDRQFYFDVPNGPMVDNKKWGGGIPLLLSGPGAMKLILQNATQSELTQYGFNTPTMTLKLTLADDTVYNVLVGDSNPNAAATYVKLADNNDVYTVDISWYNVLAAIVTSPPYVPATFAIDVPTLSSAQIAIGETETISVNVTNNGDVIGNFDVYLLIAKDNGNLEPQDTKTVTLDPRTSQVVTFTVIENTAGKYIASINSKHNITFTVK
jgi:hypothetical protein